MLLFIIKPQHFRFKKKKYFLIQNRNIPYTPMYHDTSCIHLHPTTTYTSEQDIMTKSISQYCSNYYNRRECHGKNHGDRTVIHGYCGTCVVYHIILCRYGWQAGTETQPIALPPVPPGSPQRVRNAFCPVVWETDIIGGRQRESAAES